jgi:hypothetical protein
MHNLDAHADQIRCLGQTAFTLGVLPEQGQYVSLGAGPEQRQQWRGGSSHNE